jgi:hypothetical protein
MTKGEAWRKWWIETHGQNMPMGAYHPREGAIYDAWNAGWGVGYEQSQVEITYLKEQLLRVGNQEKVLKEAYLAGQMSK